jgi:hypothetical protein
VISNEDLWVRTKKKEIWKEIRYRKWNWTDYILRQENESIAKKALGWNPQGGRRRGRPKITYLAKHSEDGSRTSRAELAENSL